MIDRVARPMTAGRLVDGEEAMSVGTTSPTRDPHVAAANLRRHGRRATSARISLMLSLSELGHATPEQLHTTLAPTHPRLNASTVYRTLESLTDIGPSPTPTSPDRPPATTSPTAPSTPTSSARTAALRGRALQRFVAELATDPGFTVTISHLTVQGHCQPCQTQRDGSPVQRDSAPANEQQQWQCPRSAATLPAQGQVPARR